MDRLIEFITAHPILSFSWIGLFIAVIYLTVKGWLSKVKEITHTEAIALINGQEAIIVDIRSANQFKQGHIANAYNILPIDIKNGSLGAIAKYRERPIIVVCDTGMNALKAATDLYKAGFQQVFTLKEGISGWDSNNLPLVKGNK